MNGVWLHEVLLEESQVQLIREWNLEEDQVEKKNLRSATLPLVAASSCCFQRHYFLLLSVLGKDL